MSELIDECSHKWKKWEKEQHIYWDKETPGYYQRRECKSCGTAQWKPVEIQGFKLLIKSGENNLAQA